MALSPKSAAEARIEDLENEIDRLRHTMIYCAETTRDTDTADRLCADLNPLVTRPSSNS